MLILDITLNIKKVLSLDISKKDSFELDLNVLKNFDITLLR